MKFRMKATSAKGRGSSPLALLAVVLVVLGAAMAGAGVLLPNYNIKLPTLSSISWSGVDIGTSQPAACYAGTPYPITAFLDAPNSSGAVLVFTITNGNGLIVASGNATTIEDLDESTVTWTWQNPIAGDYLLSITWSGSSAYPQGGSITNVPIGVQLPTLYKSSNSTTSTPPNPSAKYVNYLTVGGMGVVILGGAVLFTSFVGKRAKK
jgi:hypothetical protein